METDKISINNVYVLRDNERNITFISFKQECDKCNNFMTFNMDKEALLNAIDFVEKNPEMYRKIEMEK